MKNNPRNIQLQSIFLLDIFSKFSIMTNYTILNKMANLKICKIWKYCYILINLSLKWQKIAGINNLKNRQTLTTLTNKNKNLRTAFFIIFPWHIGTIWVKEKPESTTKEHNGFFNASSFLCFISDNWAAKKMSRLISYIKQCNVTRTRQIF